MPPKASLAGASSVLTISLAIRIAKRAGGSTWLDSLEPDPTGNHRWLYVEANRTGPDDTVSASPPWPLTIYHVADVFRAVPAPPSGTPTVPTLPGQPPASSPPPAPVAVYVFGGFVGRVARGGGVVVSAPLDLDGLC